MPQQTHLRPPPSRASDDVALDGDAATDVRYAYSYDAIGRLVHATGAYAAGGGPTRRSTTATTTSAT